jgi:hypothetical protein
LQLISSKTSWASSGIRPRQDIKLSPEAIYLNSQATLLIGGSLQWFRLPVKSWEDRLQKFKAAGFNTIEVYIPWNVVEPREGVFDFQSSQISQFLAMAQKHELYVYLRPGPYITNELDGGGIPAWLSAKANKQQLHPNAFDGSVNLRTADKDFLWYVERYFRKLNQHILPFLFTNGGPIILYAIENEYNWFEFFFKLDKHSQLGDRPERPRDQALDVAAYLQALRDIVLDQGIDIPIVTCPGEPKLTGLGEVDIAPMPNMYGSYLEHIEFHAARLRTAMGASPIYSAYPGGISETDRQPSVLKRLVLSGMDAIFQFNLAGYHGEGRSNAMVLNVQPPGSLRDLISIFRDMFQVKIGQPIIRPPVGFFHNVLDFYGPISPSGTLRPSFYAFRRLNLFLQTFQSRIAKAQGAQQTADLSSEVQLEDPSGKLGILNPDGSPATHYWLRTGEQSALLGVYNGTNRDLVLPQHSITAWGENFPVASTLTLAKADNEFGPRAGKRDYEYTHYIPIGFALDAHLEVAYSTSEILMHKPFGDGHLLILYGAPHRKGEIKFLCDQITLQTQTDTVKIVRQETDAVTFTFSQQLGEFFTLSCEKKTLLVMVVDREEAGKLWFFDAEQLLLGGVEYAQKNVGEIKIEFSAPQAKAKEYLFYTLSPKAMSLSSYQSVVGPGKTTFLQYWHTLDEDLLTSAMPTFELPLRSGRVQLEALPLNANSANSYSWTILGTQPQHLEKAGILSGHSWYRAETSLKRKDLQKSMPLKIASASDFVSLYVNGKYLLTLNPLGTEINSASSNPSYGFPVPAKVLREGLNQIVVRTEIWGHGSVAWPIGKINSLPLPQGTQFQVPLLKISLPALSYDALKGLSGPASLGSQPLTNWQLSAGIAGEKAGVALSSFDDSSWPTHSLPIDLRPGSMMWYRSQFDESDLPNPNQLNTPLALTLRGRSAKATIFLNGRMIGRWLSDNDWLQRGKWANVSREAWMNTHPDSFPVARSLLKSHDNSLAILFEDVSDTSKSSNHGRIDEIVLEFARENKIVIDKQESFVPSILKTAIITL